jgi:hypothetical protein
MSSTKLVGTAVCLPGLLLYLTGCKGLELQSSQQTSGNFIVLTVHTSSNATGTITSNPTGINCGTSCSGKFSVDTHVTLNAQPASGATFVGWGGACTGAGSCTLRLAANTFVTGNFSAPAKLLDYMLSVAFSGPGSGNVMSSPAGISCPETCAATFPSGTQVQLTATAESNSTFGGWGGACSGTGNCSVDVNADRGVVASFNPPVVSYTLSLSLAGTGSGSVSSSPSGINCGNICRASFNAGSQVNLTATPGPNSTFAGWTGACSGNTACTLTIGGNLVAVANFSTAVTLNSLGNAVLTAATCPTDGMPSATCYQAVISNCPDTAGDFVAMIKVNDPPDLQTAKGTVFFTTSGGGNGYYDSAFPQHDGCPNDGNCGLMVVQELNSAGYGTVQIDFSDPNDPGSEPAGWITGPAIYGHRSLACRYATLVHEVWVDLLNQDTQHPVCATGNSAGGSVIAYAITQYGMGNPGGPGPMFAMVEPTSGPPMARIDHGCMGSAAPDPLVTCPAGTTSSENYGLGIAKKFIDPAFSSDVCTVDIQSDGSDPDPTFLHDSVLSDDFPNPNYQTFVKVLFGSADTSQAVPLGLEWYNAITSPKAQACISGAAHELPGFLDGATTIVNDLTTFCH